MERFCNLVAADHIGGFVTKVLGRELKSSD
jgi:hypothetical protein